MVSSSEFAYETGCRYFPMGRGRDNLVSWTAVWVDEFYKMYFVPNCKISSIDKAIDWFSKSLGDESSLHAYAYATANLTAAWRRDDGSYYVKKGISKWMPYIYQAAIGGIPKAQYLYYWLITALGEQPPSNAVESAEDFLRQAAGAGVAHAQCVLGYQLAYGNQSGGVEARSEAVQWLEKSSRNGCELSYVVLGRMSFDNEDYSSAFDYFSKVDMPSSYRWLARMYQKGLHVERDYVKAYDYSSKAAACYKNDPMNNLVLAWCHIARLSNTMPDPETLGKCAAGLGELSGFYKIGPEEGLDYLARARETGAEEKFDDCAELIEMYHEEGYLPPAQNFEPDEPSNPSHEKGDMLNPSVKNAPDNQVDSNLDLELSSLEELAKRLNEGGGAFEAVFIVDEDGESQVRINHEGSLTVSVGRISSIGKSDESVARFTAFFGYELAIAIDDQTLLSKVLMVCNEANSLGTFTAQLLEIEKGLWDVMLCRSSPFEIDAILRFMDEYFAYLDEMTGYLVARFDEEGIVQSGGANM